MEIHFKNMLKTPVLSCTMLATLVVGTVNLYADTDLGSRLPKDLTPADTIAIPQVQVISPDPKKVFRNIPGTVHVIGKRELQETAPLSAGDIARKVPGIHVNDEDLAGLRLNIGVRGLNPQRSTRILVLEDGIPVTLNPYGEPQMYYSPMIDRMEGMEVLKSSGQLLFGPQTIGGVVNFITPNPPASLTNNIRLQAGGNGYLSAYASHGNSVGNAGYLVNFLHKRADQLGPLKFRVNDGNAKFNFYLNNKSKLGFKIGFYNEESNSTYAGITQRMYDQGGMDQITIAEHDLMLLDKYSASVTHQYQISDAATLQTNAFAYYIRRNWRRQDFDRVRDASRMYERIIGDPNATDGSAIFFRETARWRNRQYVVKGIEPRLEIEHSLFNIQNKLKTGVRALWETAYEQAIRTTLPDAFNGSNSENEERRGFAASAYAVNEFQLTRQLSANLGVRIEHYGMEREIFNLAANNNKNVTHDRSVVAVIPGAGVNYSFHERISLFAGVHKGFAPPVLKSALDANGIVDEIDKEESINYDLGVRAAFGEYLHTTASFFHLDFKNQVIPVTLATAGSGFANGGKSKHTGLEFGIEYDLAKSIGSQHSLSVGGNLTLTKARFADDNVKLSNSGDEIQSVRNNHLPYAPAVLSNQYISLRLNNGLGLRLSGNYVGKQYTDPQNIETAPANGTSGAIDARYLLDANLHYTIRNKYSFHISAKNLTDQRAIITRHPQGIRVSQERFISAGIDITF